MVSIPLGLVLAVLRLMIRPVTSKNVDEPLHSYAAEAASSETPSVK